jgi:membrane protein implicated in regulation of membrane protease activity
VHPCRKDTEFIDAGERLTVVRVDGNRIVVRHLRGKD